MEKRTLTLTISTHAKSGRLCGMEGRITEEEDNRPGIDLFSALGSESHRVELLHLSKKITQLVTEYYAEIGGRLRSIYPATTSSDSAQK